MKTLVTGVLGSSNLGDPILVRCTAALIGELCPGDEVWMADLTGAEVRESTEGSAPEEPSFSHLRLRLLRAGARRLISAHTPAEPEYRRARKLFEADREAVGRLLAKRPDRVVVAGGQLLMNRYALYVAELIRCCEARNIDVYLHACGTGAGADLSEHVLRELREALASPAVRLLSVRDGAEEVRSWDVGKTVVETFDAGLCASDIFGISASDGPRTPLPIGLGPICHPAVPLSRELHFWQKLTACLDSRGISWTFFGNGSPEDRVIAEEVLRRRGEDERSGHLLSPVRTPEELLEELAGLRGIISYRLHSHILALSLGLPSIGLFWDRKLPEFFSRAGMADRCLTAGNSPELILSAFFRAEEEGVRSAEAMKERTKEVLREALASGD